MKVELHVPDKTGNDVIVSVDLPDNVFVGPYGDGVNGIEIAGKKDDVILSYSILAALAKMHGGIFAYEKPKIQHDSVWIASIYPELVMSFVGTDLSEELQ